MLFLVTNNNFHPPLARIIENNRISIERQRGEERKRERNKKRKKIRTMAENPAQLRLKNLVAPASSLESGNKGSREKSWKTVLKTVNDTPPNSALYRK